MTLTAAGRFAVGLAILCAAGCSPLFEREKPVRENRLDTYLASANVDRSDVRTPALIGYGRRLDEMLESTAPVSSFVHDVSRAQQCFLRQYGNRADYRGGGMVSSLVDGHEDRWREYVRLSSSVATIGFGEDPCDY